MAIIQLKVQGMKCGGCENSVQDAVSAVSGVAAVKASHKEASVEIDYDPAQADLASIKQAITDKGFTVVNGA